MKIHWSRLNLELKGGKFQQEQQGHPKHYMLLVMHDSITALFPQPKHEPQAQSNSNNQNTKQPGAIMKHFTLYSKTLNQQLGFGLWYQTIYLELQSQQGAEAGHYRSAAKRQDFGRDLRKIHLLTLVALTAHEEFQEKTRSEDES